MRKYLVIVLCSILPIISYSQKIDGVNLVGIWQINTGIVSSGMLDTYQFFDDGKFIFNPSEYNYLQRIISIKGHYKVINDTLFLFVESTKELVGGYPSPPSPPFGKWEIIGGTIKEQNLSDDDLKLSKMSDGLTLNRCKNDTCNCSCILIDGARFYRLTKNPNNFTKVDNCNCQ